MDKIGIVGQCFVGTAVRIGLQDFYDIETYDKFCTEASSCDCISDLVNKTNTIFICVPTPMRKDGSCDTTIVESVISEINTISMEDKIVIIKSTVPPGTTERLNNNRYSNLQVVFNPEFLTEANSINDFKNQNRIIVGGPRPAST